MTAAPAPVGPASARRQPRSRRITFFRAVPYLATFVVAVALLWLPHPGVVYEPSYIIAGVGLGAVLVVVEFAVPWRRLPRRLEGVMPLASIVVIALLRHGSGAGRSMLSVLVMLPIVWLALYGDRTLLMLGIAGASVMFFLPVFLDPADYPAAEVSRALLVTMVVSVMGLTLQHLVNRERSRTFQLREAQAQQDEALRRLQDAAVTIEEQRALTQRVIDNVDVGIAACDVTGQVTFLNRSMRQLLKIPEDFPPDLLLRDDGITAYQVDGVTRVTGDRMPLLRSLQGEEIVDDEAIVYDDRGRRVWISVTSLPIRSRSGAIVAAVASVRDVTERIEASRASERLKDEFVASVSHELRTPLASIIGYLEILQDDPRIDRLDADQQRNLGVIERNAHRLLRLVGDLLFTAQVEAGTVSVRRQLTDLVAVLDDSVLAVQPRASAAGVDVRLAVDQPPPQWNVDAERIGQAVDNLLTNAVKFTRPGGRVVVRLDVQDDDAVIEVTDTGIGISPEAQAMIFDRFYRADAVERAAIPGIGLGLAISRAIAIAHDGELTLASTGPEGSTFRLVLPPAPAVEGAEVRQPAPSR